MMSMVLLRRIAGFARALAVLAGASLAAPAAHASFLSGEALAKAASVIALVVIIVVPIVLIVLFWMVHVLPEKIAHKRHHPQQEAIQVLCLLSLLGAIALTRRRAFTPLARWTWVLACGVVGVPALASLWLLYPKAERAGAVAAAPARGPATLARSAQ